MRVNTLALLVALCGILSPTATAQSDDKEPAVDAPRLLKVCFVDVKKVFEGYRKKKALEKTLNEELDAEKARLKKMVAQAESLAGTIKSLDKNTVHARRQIRKLYLLQRNIQFQRKWVEVDMAERLTKLMIQLHQEILVGIDQFAKSNEYDIVFQVNRGDINTKNPDKLRMLIRERAVLYYRKSLDKTRAVIKLLNAPATPKKAPK